MATAPQKPEGAQDFSFPDEGNDAPVHGEVDLSIKDEDVEVEIVDDTPAKDRGRQPLKKPVADPTEAELDTYTAGVKQRLKEMTHARHDSRREAEAAARERDEALNVAQRMMAENQALRQRFAEGAQAYGHMALSGAEAKLAKAKADLKSAQEAFDTDKIVEAQEALASAVQEVREAKNFRPATVQPSNNGVQPRQSQQQPQPRVHPKTLEWQAQNPWYGAEGFEEYTSYALGLHQRLVQGEKLDPRSDEYFDAINSRMRQLFPELYSEDDTATPPPKKPPVVAAPTKRIAPAGTNGGSPGKVRLSKSQVAIATKLGISPKQYAQQLLKLQGAE